MLDPTRIMCDVGFSKYNEMQYVRYVISFYLQFLYQALVRFFNPKHAAIWNERKICCVLTTGLLSVIVVSWFFFFVQLRHLRYLVDCLLLSQRDRQLDSCLASQWVKIFSTPYSRTSATDAAFLPSGFDNGIKYNESVYRKYQNIC